MPSTEDSGPAVTTIAVEETQAAEVNDELIQEMLGKYRLIRHLATGGMAEIYLAEQAGPEGFAKEIVIKRILPHLAKDQQFTAMFLDEARLAANLNHPNIGQIIELGTHGREHYIAMEFIDGASLDELLDDGVPLAPDIVARIIADTLQALDFAHESKDRAGNALNIVHRDVTPSNIMVSVDGIVKLVDFGVAKAAKKDHKTQTGAVKGKFAYMAPEQIETADIDRRADIFAIGIVFFEALTGQKPYGEELAAVSRILHDPPADPREVRPEVPDSFAQIVLRALQKDPGKRYPTAHTMLLDIETALRKVNSYAGPREISYVVRRHRGLPLPAGVELTVNDTGLFAADRSGDLPRVEVVEAEAATEESTVKPPAVTAVTAPTPRKPSTTVVALRRALSSRRNVVVGAASLGLFAVLALGVTLVAGRESSSPYAGAEPVTVVLNTTPFVEEGADPAALFDEAGRHVVIDSYPTTRIYRGDQFVGSTPFQTQLKPGKHRVELSHGSERKAATIEVDDNDRFQRATIDFAALGEKIEPPESKRKGKKGSAGSRIKRKLKSLF